MLTTVYQLQTSLVVYDRFQYVIVLGLTKLS